MGIIAVSMNRTVIGSLPSREGSRGSVSTCSDRERQALKDRIREREEKEKEEELEVTNPREWLKRKLKKL